MLFDISSTFVDKYYNEKSGVYGLYTADFSINLKKAK